MSRKRAALAGVLSLVYPGLGHAYLREWIRAVGWFGIALATASLVVPASTVQSIDSVEVAVLLEASRNLPRDALLAILFVRALNVVDAVWLGSRSSRHPEEEAVASCPECGGELDEELEFCPWCTHVLAPEAEVEAEAEAD